MKELLNCQQVVSETVSHGEGGNALHKEKHQHQAPSVDKEIEEGTNHERKSDADIFEETKDKLVDAQHKKVIFGRS